MNRLRIVGVVAFKRHIVTLAIAPVTVVYILDVHDGCSAWIAKCLLYLVLQCYIE